VRPLRSLRCGVAEMGRAGRFCEDSPSVVLATVATRRWGRDIARAAEAAGPPRRRFFHGPKVKENCGEFV
jgi:hypothetical protein